MNFIKLILLIAISTAMLNAQKTTVYAVVNGENITEKDLQVLLKDQVSEFDKLDKKAKKQIISKLVDKALISQYALKSGITNDKTYREFLEILKKDLALNAWMKNIVDKVKVSKKELRAFYNKNKSDFDKPAQYKANHILVKTKKEAFAIITQLKRSKNTKASFEKLAKEKSVGPSGKSGGSLGWFEASRMVPEFSKATMKLKKGHFTKLPVKTQFGFHIIYLDDIKKSSKVSFSSASQDIEQQLRQEKVMKKTQTILDRQKKKANIKYKI